ncbi:DegT/DnrJ/EryC1/StrS family aminotransferase, partial [Blautia sp. MSJ-9]|uniref:DegT/DnrJ/EryC1/StrS family aminotransferase n=1 Tax=Blautia sp. MSJ-9 TaxID=2841511 RepID=UPI001C100B7E
EIIGCGYAVALTSGTSALHMAIKLAGNRIYGKKEKALEGKKVFCSDLTFCASVNPVVYEGGEPVFIDCEQDTWNMSPEALEKAFQLYPDVKIVILVHLYGTPARMDEIRKVTDKYGAVIVEDAAEALGAAYKGRMAGSLGDYSVISFNGNKIITGSSGGMFLTDKPEDADRVRKWSTQSKETAPWYQHEEMGYNYRMSNVVAGVIRGQLLHLDEHISQKRRIFERYKEGLKDLPIKMNEADSDMNANHWLSCMLINPKAMCHQNRTETTVEYEKESGKTCPTEILEALTKLNAEGRSIWKPMHMQPIYSDNEFVMADGSKKSSAIGYDESELTDVGADIFSRGICLPSDIKMTQQQQDRIIETVSACFE